MIGRAETADGGMRICFLSSMHTATDKRVFEKEARTLVQAGHVVSHLAPGDGGQWTQNGVHIVTYRAGSGLPGRAMRLVWLYRAARGVGADVYHCNEIDSWIVGVALRLLAGKRCVFDVHEHYPEEFAETRFPPWTRGTVRGLISGMMRLLARYTDRIVLAKKSLQDSFGDLPAGSVYVVENFASLARLRPPRGVQNGTARMRMVHLGLINRYRGWPQLLESMAHAHCKDVELIIIGSFDDDSEPAFRDSVARLGLTERVRVERWLPFAEAMERLVEADVGLICFQPGLFNHDHALPHKLFDYMGAELAVIAPRVSVEVSEIISSAECGVLVDSADPSSIAEAIDRLARDRALVREMGRRGREAVVDRYNWEAEARKLTSMYEGLAAS